MAGRRVLALGAVLVGVLLAPPVADAGTRSLAVTGADFGTVQIGARATREVTVTNSGSDALTELSVYLEGVIGPFSIEQNACPRPGSYFMPGATCAVTISMEAREAGSFPADINAADVPTKEGIPIVGAEAPVVVVVEAPVGEAVFDGDHLSFYGRSKYDALDQRQRITLTNEARIPVDVTLPSVTGKFATAYRVVKVGACSTKLTLEPGGACELAVEFRSKRVVLQTATLRLGAATTTLIGSACDPAAKAHPVAYEDGDFQSNPYLCGRRVVTKGTPKRDVIHGSQLSDQLAGGAGNDVLHGHAGSDTLMGGPGNDTLNAIDGQRDKVNCGPGRDRASVDRRDVVVGCESTIVLVRPAGGG